MNTSYSNYTCSIYPGMRIKDNWSEIRALLSTNGCDLQVNGSTVASNISATGQIYDSSLLQIRGYNCVLARTLIDECQSGYRNGRNLYRNLYDFPGVKPTSIGMLSMNCLVLSLCIAENIAAKKFYKNYRIQGDEPLGINELEIQLNSSKKQTLIWYILGFLMLSNISGAYGQIYNPKSMNNCRVKDRDTVRIKTSNDYHQFPASQGASAMANNCWNHLNYDGSFSSGTGWRVDKMEFMNSWQSRNEVCTILHAMFEKAINNAKTVRYCPWRPEDEPLRTNHTNTNHTNTNHTKQANTLHKRRRCYETRVAAIPRTIRLDRFRECADEGDGRYANVAYMIQFNIGSSNSADCGWVFKSLLTDALAFTQVPTFLSYVACDLDLGD